MAQIGLFHCAYRRGAARFFNHRFADGKAFSLAILLTGTRKEECNVYLWTWRNLLRSRDRLDHISDAAADSRYQHICSHCYHHSGGGWCSGHHLAQERYGVRLVRDRPRYWLFCLLWYWLWTLWQARTAALADASCCFAYHSTRCGPYGCR